MKRYRVHLTASEQGLLKQHIRAGKYKGTRLRRAQILLGSDESAGGLCMTDEAIHKSYGASLSAVERTRRRFVEKGFEMALHGKERPVNAKRIIDARAESHLLAMRCSSELPRGYNKWTLRLLADRMVELGYVESISHQGVSDILKKHQLSLGKSSRG